MPKTSSSTHGTLEHLNSALQGIPSEFRTRLIAKYLSIREAYAEGNYDTVGLRVGVFCEVVLRLLQQQLTGSHTAFGTKIRNFADDARALEKLPSTAGDEALRVIMPRALLFAYTLRNKRGVGHAAADVDANQIDAATGLRIADWCVCELIRILHAVSLEEAQALLDAIAVRQYPEIWAVGGKKRILITSLTYPSQVLLHLHAEDSPVLVEDLCAWIEHPRMRDFRAAVLRPLHKKRLIEYDEETQTVALSPSGAEEVESKILPSMRNLPSKP